MADQCTFRRALLLLLVLGLGFCCDAGETVFNVLDFGAVGDGQTDDTKAFVRAWNLACTGHEALDDFSNDDIPVFYVPGGRTFLLQHLKLHGPCVSSGIHVQIAGTLVAPGRLDEWTSGCQDEWLGFENVENLKVDGGGRIVGHGEIWWEPRRRLNSVPGCDSRPTSLSFHASDNLQLSNLEFVNSPRNHISISGTKGGDISNLSIIAPADSPNTDGINLSHSSDIRIHDSRISTGDDCFAINGGCSRINITNINCGPGHGISVGSLGKDGAEETVEEVYVFNCTLRDTTNGLRIKTWPGGRGYARKITFHDIRVLDVKNPIIIDQAYCDHKCQQGSTAVEISDVTYSKIRGTSKHPCAVTLNCDSAAEGCKNIVMQNVNLRHGGEKETFATCNNVYGSASNVYPEVNCLSETIVQY